MLLQLLIVFPRLITNGRNVLNHLSTIVPHPIMSHTGLMACFLSGENLQKQGVLLAAADIILLVSCKSGTEWHYCPHVQRWSLFCSGRNVDLTSPTINHINFLTENYDRGVGYECVNTARGALSSLSIVVDGCRAGNHTLVIRFMRGVFSFRTPQPRYTDTWGVQPVLENLGPCPPYMHLTLKDLTLTLVMALTQAARIRTLLLLFIRDMLICEHVISVQLRGICTQSGPY